MNKLYLIDGMSLVFRAYHAMVNSNLQSPSGEPTYAVFGFINIMYSLIKGENPKHLVVAFDTQTPTFRHEMYEDYKANRDEFPEPLVPQLKRIKEFLTLAGIPQIEAPGFEADDVIGSIAKQCKDYEVWCITADKDYYQLVEDRIKLLKPSRTPGKEFDLVDLSEVQRKFGGTPEQVRDVLALIGDSSDNIPGVKGIGEKTAIPLVLQYGTIDGIYANIDNIPQAGVRNKLIAGKESAYQALELVTIKTDMEIPPFEMEMKDMNNSALMNFFTELNFNQFKRKWIDSALIPSGDSVIAEVQTEIEKFDATKVEYKLINTIEKLKSVVAELNRYSVLAVDTETSGLDRMSCQLAGISLSAVEGKAYYIAVEDENTQTVESQDSLFNFDAPKQNLGDRIPVAKACEILKPLLENKEIRKCGQNIKFDALILKRYGITVSPIDFDTMIAGHILNPDSALNLDSLSKQYLNYEPIPIEAIIGVKKSEQKLMTELAPELICDYASEDADIALRLRNKLEQEINNNNQTKLSQEIEFPLIEVLTDMEFTGIKIDVAGLKEISITITEEIKNLSAKIFEEAGTQFNIDSPKQLGEILFDVMMIPPIKKTKTGYSTDVDTLSALKYTHPIAEYLLQYRQLTKLKNTYIDALPKMINPATGRLHTSYNQTGTNTGRLSSSDPNLQNIPIRSEMGKEVRKAFITGYEDYDVVSADYSQIELRIMAYFSQDPNLIKAFKDGADIHAATAAILNDIPIEEVNSDQRRIAKTVNFGIMYGLGAFGLAQRLGMGRKEAADIIANYFAKYPGIKQYMHSTIADTEQKGYAETLCGRRRYFPEINSSNNNIRTAQQRAAINMPIQGTASDMIKIAMLRVHRALSANNMRAKLLLQVHDELVLECPKSETDTLIHLVKSEMESALALGDVPVLVEVGIGSNWLEAH